MGTDRDWEKWGRDDPYFGVLSLETFRAGNLSEGSRNDFFRSGEAHIASLFDIIRARFDSGFEPGESLDFGCGVGRLLIPLARRSRRATGTDISPSMLAEARRNCDQLHVENVDLISSDDRVCEAHGQFDLITSHIVFAHIDPRRGHAIFDTLAAKVSSGGFVAVQVLYACNAPRWKRSLVKLRYRLTLLNALRNLLRRRPLREPPMQLHVYELPKLLHSLNRLGFDETLLVTDHFDDSTFDSVVIIARRQLIKPSA